MSADRHERVVSLIHELAATFIQQEANTDPMITLTKVTTSPDYRQCTIHFTTSPEGREEDALVFLTRYAGELRRFIMKKSDLKIIPHISFAVDAGERQRQHIDDIARDIERGEQ